jgi:adenylosuccinate lyase
MTRIVSGLTVREENVKANLEKAGLTSFSGHYLLALVKEGATREDAYAWVQSCALASFEGQGDFIELLEKHEEIRRHLSPARIRQLGSMKFQLRHVKEIYASVLGAKKTKRPKR